MVIINKLYLSEQEKASVFPLTLYKTIVQVPVKNEFRLIKPLPATTKRDEVQLLSALKSGREISMLQLIHRTKFNSFLSRRKAKAFPRDIKALY